MPATIRSVRAGDPADGLEELVREYLSWDISELRRLSGIPLEAGDYIANTFAEIDKYRPPAGRILLAEDAGQPVGMAFLKPIRDGVCEIKRMYVRPEGRGSGLGRRLLNELIDAARQIGYATVLLDSSAHMTSAHALYRSVGFRDVDYYPEGETDERLGPYMVYMKMDLREAREQDGDTDPGT